MRHSPRASRDRYWKTSPRVFPTRGWATCRHPITSNTSRAASKRRARLSRRRCVREPVTYDYAVIRVVPRVDREEFVNVGVIVSCQKDNVLEARIEIDEARLRALDPSIDVEAIRGHLAAIPAIAAG